MASRVFNMELGQHWLKGATARSSMDREAQQQAKCKVFVYLISKKTGGKIDGTNESMDYFSPVNKPHAQQHLFFPEQDQVTRRPSKSFKQSFWCPNPLLLEQKNGLQKHRTIREQKYTTKTQKQIQTSNSN